MKKNQRNKDNKNSRENMKKILKKEKQEKYCFKFKKKKLIIFLIFQNRIIIF